MKAMEHSRLLRLDQVMELVPLSKSLIYQLIREEEFPLPIKMGRNSLWSYEEVTKWFNKKMANRHALEQPSHLKKPKRKTKRNVCEI